MDSKHPDYIILNRIRSALYRKAGGEEQLQRTFPELVQGAIEFVIDPIRTGRNSIKELDNVEKTFIGLKIEHFFRDFLDVPKGLRDLRLDGLDVDIKNTVAKTWTIPPETYSNEEPCILIAIAEQGGYCQLGMMVARRAYLCTGPNRDRKLAVSSEGKKNILWIIENAKLPPNPWTGIDLAVFRRLRGVKGGSKRAAEFFRAHVGTKVHRSVVQALLHDQRDYMKRLRENGGARDLLQPELMLLVGAWKEHQEIAAKQGIALHPDEIVAVKVDTT